MQLSNKIRNLKILFLINNLEVGGAEKVFITDANKLYKQGYDIYIGIIYGMQDRSPLNRDLMLPSENVVYFGGKNIFDFNCYIKLIKFLISKNVDTIYATLHDAIFFGRVSALFKPSASLYIREANTLENKSLLHKIADFVLNFRAKKLIAVSYNVGESIRKFQPLYKNKIVILQNGIELPGEVNKLEKEPIQILSVGSLTDKKNHTELIKAFAKIILDFKNLKLIIIGEGKLRKDLEKEIVDLNLYQHVSLPGSKTQEELKSEYINSTLFVLPSKQEGSPNALLEAMSYGMPCVASSIGGLNEIIENNISGVLYKCGDIDALAHSLRELLLNYEKRCLMGRNGRQRVKENFTQERHLDLLKNILDI